MQKGQEFKWTPECQEALVKLRHRLTSTPVVVFPDYNLPFHHYTDESLYVIGVILAQVQEDWEHILACTSSSLTLPEKNYAATKGEYLGIVWALHHFQPYTAGTRTTVVTDHQSIHWLRMSDTHHTQFIRWRGVLEEFEL